MKDPTGLTLFTYDDLYRLAGVTDPSGRKVGYEYDQTGAVTAVTYPEGQAARYEYDTLGRLATVCSPQGTTRTPTTTWTVRSGWTGRTA
ncbi:MAG: hypothetical protein ACYC9Q_04060 [Bacillota bacterium]